MKPEEMESTLAAFLVGADRVGLNTMLIGSWAIELTLSQVEQREVRTDDVDVALELGNWGDLDRLVRVLQPSFDFQPDDLQFRGVGTVDVVPFGGIEAPAGRVDLHDSTRALTTIGMQSILARGTRRRIGDATIGVPSIPGLVLLKLLAFMDNRNRLKDLSHLRVLFAELPPSLDPWADPPTLEALNCGRLQHEDLEIWELGHEIRALAPDAITTLLQALDALASADHRGALASGPTPDRRIERADRIIQVLRLAFGQE